MQNNNQNPFLKDNYAPWPKESECQEITKITGKIPEELNGVLYRNGPNPQFPTQHSHWFEGDGMIHAITIANGKVSYQNRWVQTERFQLESEAGKALFNNFASNLEQKEKNDLGTANTNIIKHGGKLLALQEGSYPIEMNAHDLKTIGKWDCNGNVPQMSAHPHFDYQTSEMHNHAYTAGTKEIVYFIFNADGTLNKKTFIAAPYSSFMHDFFITKNYVIFPVLPLTICRDRVKDGRPFIAWEGDKSAFIGIMPRNGGNESVSWFELDAFYAFHYMNAYEEEGCIILDGMKSKRAHLFPDLQGNVVDPSHYPPQLTRWKFNLKQMSVKESQLDSMPAEFPRFDERFTGIQYNHGYAAGYIENHSYEHGFNILKHYNFSNNSETSRIFNPSMTINEPIFVPRKQHSNEGDGFLLSIVYDASSQNSFLYIFDAMHIDQDPIAIIALPNRIPNGFHGNWYDF